MDEDRNVNPAEKAVTGEFYYATVEKHSPGERVRKGTEHDDVCLMATASIDECIFIDGCAHVYRVSGTSCKHYWSQTVTGTRQNVVGGYGDVLIVETFPESMRQFDEIQIEREIPMDEFFGDNGPQVAHLISWMRSKYYTKGDQLIPKPEFNDALESMVRYVQARTSELTWPLGPFRPYDSSNMTPSARTSSRFWLKPQRFTQAWVAAYDISPRPPVPIPMQMVDVSFACRRSVAKMAQTRTFCRPIRAAGALLSTCDARCRSSG